MLRGLRKQRAEDWTDFFGQDGRARVTPASWLEFWAEEHGHGELFDVERLAFELVTPRRLRVDMVVA